MSPEESPKFVAVLDEVCEVSLLGLADAACWKHSLHQVGLQPARKEGRAQILLSAVQASYMGVAFREVSLSISVRHPTMEGGKHCLYLAHAFNSSRLFSLVERAVFRTPYYPAHVEVNAQLPAAFAASHRNASLLRAQMGREAGAMREPVRSGYDEWEGPIFLPQLRERGAQRRRWFAARLAGDAHVYPFIPAQDRVLIAPSVRWPALQILAESNFGGREWIIRESALHARSKTFTESEALTIAKVDAPALETPG